MYLSVSYKSVKRNTASKVVWKILSIYLRRVFYLARLYIACTLQRFVKLGVSQRARAHTESPNESSRCAECPLCSSSRISLWLVRGRFSCFLIKCFLDFVALKLFALYVEKVNFSFFKESESSRLILWRNINYRAKIKYDFDNIT